MTPAEFIRAQLKVLDQLFEGKTPKKASQHPGVRRRMLLQEVLRNGGTIRLPEQHDQLPLLGRAMLDTLTLVQLTGGNWDELRLGDIANLGSSEVLTKVRTRVFNPTQFEDVLTELSAGAWYQSRGHAVELLEEAGLPDLRVRINGVADPLYVECKRMCTKSLRAVVKDVKDANKKFRRLGESHFGVVMIDVSSAVEMPDTLTDDVPKTLEDLKDIVERALSGPKNRGVAKAVLTWDEPALLPTAERPDAVAFRRRFLVVDHAWKADVRVLPAEVPVFEGFTVMARLDWRPRWLGVQSIALSSSGDAALKVFGLVPQDLLDAFHRHDKLKVLRFGAMLEIVAFLKHVEKAGVRKDVFGWGNVSGQTLSVLGALVLPTTLSLEAEEWTLEEILQAVVDRYGADVETAHQRGRLIAYDQVAYQEGEPLFKAHHPAEGDWMAFASIHIRD